MLQRSTADKKKKKLMQKTSRDTERCYIPRAGDVRSPQRDESLVGLVMKRAASVSTPSSVLQGGK